MGTASRGIALNLYRALLVPYIGTRWPQCKFSVLPSITRGQVQPGHLSSDGYMSALMIALRDSLRAGPFRYRIESALLSRNTEQQLLADSK